MKYLCPKAKETKEKIQCTATGDICVHQYFRQCKGNWWHTQGALKCKAKEWKNG